MEQQQENPPKKEETTRREINVIKTNKQTKKKKQLVDGPRPPPRSHTPLLTLHRITKIDSSEALATLPERPIDGTGRHWLLAGCSGFDRVLTWVQLGLTGF